MLDHAKGFQTAVPQTIFPHGTAAAQLHSWGEEALSRTLNLRQKLHEKKRKFFESKDVGPSDHLDLFHRRLKDKVEGKSLSDLIAIEVFSGTAGLCAAVGKLGLSSSVGVDAHVSKKTKAPVLRIDLSNDEGVALLWRIVNQDNVIFLHMGPPCGTSSRAREIRRRAG